MRTVFLVDSVLSSSHTSPLPPPHAVRCHAEYVAHKAQAQGQGMESPADRTPSVQVFLTSLSVHDAVYFVSPFLFTSL